MTVWIVETEDRAINNLVRYNHSRSQPEPDRRSHEHHYVGCMMPDGGSPGDRVILWRLGDGGGIVAHGRVMGEGQTANYGTPAHTSMRYASSGNRWARARPVGSPILLEARYFDNPVNEMFLQQAYSPYRTNEIKQELTHHHIAVLPDEDWPEWEDYILGVPRQPQWPNLWGYDPGDTANRRELRDLFGGAISKPSSFSRKTPNGFVFLDGGDATRGAALWRASSGGQIFVHGATEWNDHTADDNRTFRRHLRRGLPLRVFELRDDLCRYLGSFSIDEDEPVAEWIDAGSDHVAKSAGGKEVRWPKQIPLFNLKPDGPTVEPGSWPKDAYDDYRSIELTLADRHGPPSMRRGHSMTSGGFDPGDIRRLAHLARKDSKALAAIAALPDAQMIASLVQRHQRLQALADLERAVADPRSKEIDLQRVLELNVWMFGEGYRPKSARRGLTALDRLDLSLIRPDGSLHGVELKLANPPKPLAREHRSHVIVGEPVHEAASQAMNYLRSLDEQSHTILRDQKIDCRRSTMTVVIGHPDYLPTDIAASDFFEAIRTYNSHLARVQIVTYFDLIHSARRCLDAVDTTS